ncbi:MAG: hypothetical protein NZT92_23705, partial [Abditibacteriales bacterium]|nr:hypothetical protein [Abditibacteriales bacterium]
NPTDENARGRPYVAIQPELGKAETSDRLAMKSEAETTLRRPRRGKLAFAPKSKGTPPMSAPLATGVSAHRLSKKKPRPAHVADEVLIAKMSVPSSVARERDTLRPLPEGVSSQAAGDIMGMDEKNVLLVLNATPPPVEEAANYVRTLIAEVADLAPVGVVDVTAATHVEKRPERLLTEWMTETGD